MLQDRVHRQRHQLHPAVVALHRHARARRRLLARHRVAEQRPQVHPQPLARDRQQLPRRQPRGRFQVLPGLGRVVDDVSLGVHHHVRRGEPVQHLGLHRLPQRRPGRLRRVLLRGNGWTDAPQHRRQAERPGSVLLAEDAVALVQRREQVAELADVLRRAEEQAAVRPQRVVGGGDHLALHVRPEVDQQVAARHEVHAGERRVPDDAVGREHAKLPHLLGQHEAVAVRHEEPRPPFGRDRAQQHAGVARRPGHAQRVLVDVGGEHLHAGRVRQPVQVLAQQDGDGVHLLAGGAARHPDPHGVVRPAAVEQAGDDQGCQGLERFRVPEEVGDVDQQVPEQRPRFRRVLLQAGHVGSHRVHLHDLHAALHPAQERLDLVAREVMPGLPAQDVANLRPRRIERRRALRVRPKGSRPVQRGLAAGELCQLGAHLLGRHHEIHVAGRDGAARHVRVRRAVAVIRLRQGQPAMLLDRLDAQRAVPVAAGQHHGRGALALVHGERAEEQVDQLALPALRVLTGHRQPAACHAQDRIRQQDVDPVGLHQLAIGRWHDLHVRVAGHDLMQQALAVRTDMGHHHHGQARIARQAAENALQRVDPARGRADADDREDLGFHGARCPSCLVQQ